MTKSFPPTQEQLEQKLLERIQQVYLKILGHQPQQISCKLLDKNLTVIIEDSVTQPEQLLIDIGKGELAQEVRTNIHLAFEPYLKSTIEEVTSIPLTDLISKSSLDSGRTSIVAILAHAPELTISS
ncbi:DUF2294 domain-containing protein [Synechocystis sp. PCC 7509]|uniref:DUF2294 domain-containing protein n=1 Tax=Synechocystis sp. PCC 7509 TaxID=927677 RepID=UPI0002ACAD79|nr:DUF2294 domain-containing protein [Synechocystis sp. PCC 7509]